MMLAGAVNRGLREARGEWVLILNPDVCPLSGGVERLLEKEKTLGADLKFEDIIPPADFAAYATQWSAAGVQIIGGCCGLSPDHIAAIAALKEDPA